MFYLVYQISTAIKGEFEFSMMFPCQKGIVLVIQTSRFRKGNKHTCKYFLHIHCMCKHKNNLHFCINSILRLYRLPPHLII